MFQSRAGVCRASSNTLKRLSRKVGRSNKYLDCKTKSGLRPNCRKTSALIYRREALFLDPNTTSTCTRNESELILLVPVLGTSQRESRGNGEESERDPRIQATRNES